VRIVVKGGSWFDAAIYARSASRRPRLRDEMDVNLGLRLVRELGG
jgi:formylglycine-generating enzyme required for sulfatase activity